MNIPAWLFDGVTATRHPVQVNRDGDQLFIEGHDPVAFADLIRRSDGARTVFGRKGNPGWRLGFDGPIPEDWLAALPAAPRYGRVSIASASSRQ